MMVSMFLLVLTGALIQTQSGVFAVAQSSDARLRARAACTTLYDYCLYQIEHNRDWGKGGFRQPGEVDPARTEPGGLAALDSRVEITSVEGNLFRGYLTEHNSGFEVEVINALTAPAGASSLDGLATGHEQVRLRISAWDGRESKNGSRSRQQVDCLLRLAPLYDASVLSRGKVEVATQQALFASKDPFRNEIRGENGVDLPGLTSGRTRFVEHDQTVTRPDANLDTMQSDSTGMLWSGGDISQNDTPNPLSDDPALLAQAARRSGGRLVSDANSRADIYDLKPENIPQPTFHNSADPFQDRDIEVPPGEYRFTKAMATVHVRKQVDRGRGPEWEYSRKQESVDVVEYYDPPSSSRPQKVMRSRTKSNTPSEEVLATDVDYGADMSAIPVIVGDRFAVDQTFQNDITTQDLEGNPVQAPEMGFREIGDASAPVVINLSDQSVTVLPETRVRPQSRPDGSSLPPSAFELTVREGSGGTPTLPTFNLGSGNNDVVLEADGDISIGAGYTKGLGTVISKQGNVTLNPLPQTYRWVQKEYMGYTYWALEIDSGDMEVSANDKYAGLVIYADKDVRIANISNADWTFKGFVYARGNFDFDVNGKNTTFYGSVVAGNNPGGNDHFRIQNGNRATFIYDPDYLKLLTQQLPWNWTRVEPLVWSEGNG